MIGLKWPTVYNCVLLLLVSVCGIVEKKVSSESVSSRLQSLVRNEEQP